MARLVAIYYWLTPAFWALDVFFGANLRAAAFEGHPVWKAIYYLFCFGCGVAIWLRPAWTSLVGLTESTINILALLLGFFVPYFRLIDQLASGAVAADASAFTIERALSLLLSGLACAFAIRMHAAQIRGDRASYRSLSSRSSRSSHAPLQPLKLPRIDAVARRASHRGPRIARHSGVFDWHGDCSMPARTPLDEGDQMKLLNRNRLATLTASLALMTLISAQASAATVTYKLVRLTLTNVSDAAGLWQHEGGDVRNANNVKIGKYALHRRVTTGGTDEQNTAMVTLTIFYLGGSPPRNITLQGAHSYSNGRYVGGVSATSSGLTAFADGTFVGNASTGALVITY